ncbi:N,N-dimethylformamidase beta subunit family domain-containing protein [Desertimonas flava]|uniref:N,N-dimethylformamidase beta subunit family domain-containing protein n=1 Tax=Desertimonas flava TaxID=2064846 RepID=UPI000E344615|nr:N,N-dimethylformamidase beta subunit family domain-containing protein [Desertimonas flava]
MAFETVTGYCWPQSVAAPDRVAVHLSSAGGRPVAVEVARVGARRELVWSADAVPAEYHVTPPDADRNGCDWPAALTIDIPEGWRSGYYEVVLSIDADGRLRRSHAFFVVRPAATSTAPILLALSTNTWHAYNDFGGRNLYTGGTTVSLRRPMSPGFLFKPDGAGRRVTVISPPDRSMAAHVGYLQLNHLSPWAGSAGWPDWEEPFLAWAEREGYAIDVVTNADLADHPELLDDGRYRLYLSVGHDEYWSAGMRDTVERFIANGGNAAFLSGNTSFWQVRLEPSNTDEPADRMVGYKGRFRDDPVFGTDRQALLTAMWSDVLVGRPENSMTGVSFTRGGYHRIGKRVTLGAGGYTMYRPEHWLFDGTGLDYGDVLGSDATVVGYECDGCDFTFRDGLPYPTGRDGTPAGFEILALAPAAHFTRDTATRPPAPNEPSELEFIASRVDGGGRDPASVARLAHGHAVFGTYTSPSGGTVVTTGSTDWAHGLAARHPMVEQVTRNLLDRLSSRPD